MRLVVVGAGLSGLTAAYYLHRHWPEAEISLLEASQRVGGVIETEHRDGWLVEHGADCFSVTPPDALQLCRDLGVADQLIEPLPDGRRAMISQGDRLWPVPEGFVLMRPTRLGQVLKSPLLSWRGKLRLAAERFVRPRPDTGDESLASFVRRRLGNEALERLVQPLVGGIYTADAERLSMQATMPQFVKMEREHGSLLGATLSSGQAGDNAAEKAQRELERTSSGARYGQFRVLPRGMGALFAEIESRLPANTVQLGKSVTSLTRQAEGNWQLTTADQASLMADGVVLALPAPKLAELLTPVHAQAAEKLWQIEYASSAIVLLAVADAQVARMPQAFGFVVPAIDGRKILAASFASHKFPERTPEGHTLIRVFIGGALQPELLSQTDDALVQIARDELASLIGLQGEPVWSAVQRWNRAMPQYHVGHRELAAAIEQDVATLPGLEIAGNSLHGVGIAPVVGTAKRAVKRLGATPSLGGMSHCQR